jgi:hypothetical protein
MSFMKEKSIERGNEERETKKDICKKLGHDWHTPGPHGNQPTRCWRCGIVRSES